MPLAPPQGPSGVLSAAGKFPPPKLSVPLGLGEDSVGSARSSQALPDPAPTSLCALQPLHCARWEAGARKGAVSDPLSLYLQ